jgi:mycofactocin precursor
MDNETVPEATVSTSEADGGAIAMTPIAPTLIDAELLIEEISIDGMCGVY